MFKEMYQLAQKAGYSGFCIPEAEEMTYAFTSREEPAAAPIPAWKVRWFSMDDDKFVIHTAITNDKEVSLQLRAEFLYEDTPGTFIETMLSAANKVKRTKASGLSASTFAARFYGLNGTQAEKFASLLELSRSPATVDVVPHGEIVQAYRDCGEWSVSCMTSRPSRVEIYDSSTDCAMLIIQRGEEKMGRVLIFRPRELTQWTRSREDTLEGTNPDLNGWYYTRVYGRGMSCGFTDPEGENYTRRAIEALGCRSGTFAPAGHVVCLRSVNDRAPWFDAYCGAELWYDGSEGRECVVSFNDTTPDWVRDNYDRFHNNLEYNTFSGGCDDDGLECRCCGNMYHEDDMSYIDGVGDVCAACVDDEYTWVEETGSYESNESVATHCYDSRNVLADDYVSVERPHMEGCWVCDEGDEVEICGSFYYGPDIESGRVEVLGYRLVPKEVGVELHLQINQEPNVSIHWMDMEIDGTSVKVGVDYDVNRLMQSGGRHVLKAPLFGTREESFYATLWRVEEDGSRVQRLLTKFGCSSPVMVDTEWTVVAAARSNSWFVGDKLGRYMEHKLHSWKTLIVDGVAYTILSDRRSTMTVSSVAYTAGPRIVNGDMPYVFQYLPAAVSDVRYEDATGHYYLTGEGPDMFFNTHATTRNGYDLLAYTGYYGSSVVHGVVFHNHLVRVSHLDMSAEQAARRLSRIDNTCLDYAATGSVEDLKRAILNQLTASENA